jgi:hypothetical protein
MTVPGQGHLTDVALAVPAAAGYHLATSDVPKADPGIPPGAGENATAVGREDGTGDTIGMLLELANLFAAVQVPEPNDAVVD